VVLLTLQAHAAWTREQETKKPRGQQRQEGQQRPEEEQQQQQQRDSKVSTPGAEF